MTRFMRTLLVASAIVFASAAAHASLVYTFMDLAPTGANTYSRAYSINNRGQIIGSSDSTVNPPADIILWQLEVSRVLGPLSPCASSLKINDRGQVATMESNAVIIDTRTGITQTLNGVGIFSSATGINNHGLAVGYERTATGNDRAFLWNPSIGNGRQAVRDLGSIGGQPTDWSDAEAINDRGEIVGESQDASGHYHAFVWNNGFMTDIGTAFTANSVAYGINDKGTVIGWVLNGSVTGFIWMNGQITMLPFIPTSINNDGEIVGFSDTGFFPIGTPYLYEAGSITDLNSVVSEVPGTLINAFDINDEGQIVGGYRTSDGAEHGYLLTPCPEPPTSILLFLALSIGIGAYRKIGNRRMEA